MDQSHKFVLGLKDEMTWSHGDKQKRTLAYLDRCVADREGKKFVMTHEGTIVSQEDDQYLKEITIAELVNEDKGNFLTLEIIMKS